MSPVVAKLHDVVSAWLVDLLHLPSSTGVAFVSGATVANATCLAAARDALLRGAGWDVQSQGLFGAPPISVVVGTQRHSTLSHEATAPTARRDPAEPPPASRTPWTPRSSASWSVSEGQRPGS